MYKKLIKPVFDRILAIVLIVALAPFLGLVAVLILVFDGRPIFFSQIRSGIEMKNFNLYKFRSLVPLENSDLSIDQRKFTKTGKVLRRTGIDELPQLWNIMKGEMSFVGPRPLPVEYREHYRADQKKRFQVMPGITGWAQLKGRNRISWDEKFKLDTWYVEQQSFLLDLKICFLTLGQLLKFQPEHQMPVFNGLN